ncbi:DUF192 domain-containing protein [Terriglobus sp. 2YAB30_2]|uniref:DUF192 domain-containing protein n=1 Tax=unclassified Terriglobus TaxID=2628988 RepID=UPI003F9B5CDB
MEHSAMALLKWISGIFASHAERPEIHLIVKNTTRHTELARCIDVADTSKTRRKGLLGRKQLSTGEGLWIVPCGGVHTFRMQFSIDLVYLSRDKRVRKIRHNVPPWRISLCLLAHSVLELEAGSVRRSGTRRGDRLELPLAPNKSV